MRRAYFSLLENRAALPVYVNYAKSLALEPLFHHRANALTIFRQWVLLKIAVAACDTFKQLELVEPEDLTRYAYAGRKFIQSLEVGIEPDDLQMLLAPSGLIDLLESASNSIASRRTVLLLDDAAHAFSPDQQREFFEIFRQLRTRRISPKAAVYPGVTSYSPYFHVGHEAELVEAWHRPDNHGYLPLMHNLVLKRLPPDLANTLLERPDTLNLLAFASFGIPRGFLNMIAQVLRVDEGEPRIPTRARTLQAIAEHADATNRIFRSLAEKLPRFRHFIDVGSELIEATRTAIQDYNVGRDLHSKAVVVAIQSPLTAELERLTKFLEYAGIFREIDSVSRGEKGVFERFALHYSFLITANSLSLGKTYALSDLVAALSKRDPHAFVRRSPQSLLGSEYRERCKLDLPPCEKCGAARVSEEQRYCIKCGNELSRASIYKELLQSSIEMLPLTETKINGIKNHTTLRTVQDVLADDENQLIDVPYIGPVWQARIRTYAEEYISV
ncbi:MAG: hypothetical protein VBE63_11680 [Lamprobacter sp.]|uniref:hypothetical protein n=1 Tax=Lamprobacter sp. TaxID=3100796 RepID=UPI002B25DEB1|nr:hypothetical protein [Lamprobacter sp.]MEA3640587.1 hypothetical protein [Lamprobacter sp.]